MIVNVIEPNHGTVFDPACGSGGMFVQSSHFIEHQGDDTAKKVVFYGQEKNPDTIRIAQMNLAVHGLEGKIAEAITYYQDEHALARTCDFVMANPPFNVDLVDAERIKSDSRLPFGLPGVNKQKRVSNANYLWISYFWSYLNEQGRAGFVMSSQASGAGHGEKDVRKKLVETDDVDVMISVRSNFFYTRTVPCELWFLDRSKPTERRDKVLMLDARNVFRKVSRKIYDFSPEQMQNLAAIVWLYRGQQGRFLALVRSYFDRLCFENEAIPPTIAAFEEGLADLRQRFQLLAGELAKAAASNGSGSEASKSSVAAFLETAAELETSASLYRADAERLMVAVRTYNSQYREALLDTNQSLHSARLAYDPHSEAIRGLLKQVDLMYRLTAQAAAASRDAATALETPDAFDRRAVARIMKQLEASRRTAVGQLKQAVYFHRQIAWLQERFPEAELRAVPGLVRLVSRTEIAGADWSLSPGRYVGVALPEEDEDFDFEQVLSDIRAELADLNAEAIGLSARIQANLEELGA